MPLYQGIASLQESGAGGGTRTRTPSLAMDFESTSSTNSNTPASMLFKSFPGVPSEKSEGHRGGT